jgi:hypothetical protein
MMSIMNRTPTVRKSSLQERNMMCGSCHGAREGGCSSRYSNNGQTERCLAAYRKEVSA